MAGLSYFHVRGGSGTTAGTCQLDNVRIGTTWADVTPTCISAGVSNPSDESTSPGQTATFSVTGSGTDPTYQWQTNYGGGWENISGATNARYTTPPEVLTDNGLQFQCIVTAPCNGSTATSAAATLTVANCVAAAVSNPTNVTVSPTQTATFSVTPTGTSPTFQWQTNNGGAGFGNFGRGDQFELHHSAGSVERQWLAIPMRRQRGLRGRFFRDLGARNSVRGLQPAGSHGPEPINPSLPGKRRASPSQAAAPSRLISGRTTPPVPLSTYPARPIRVIPRRRNRLPPITSNSSALSAWPAIVLR